MLEQLFRKFLYFIIKHRDLVTLHTIKSGKPTLQESVLLPPLVLRLLRVLLPPPPPPALPAAVFVDGHDLS